MAAYQEFEVFKLQSQFGSFLYPSLFLDRWKTVEIVKEGREVVKVWE